MGADSKSRLLSDGLWPELRKLPRAGQPILAAIAYYSRDQLRLRRGDLLVVDASEKTVSSGSTNATLLLSLHRAGVAIHHLPGLHAKVIQIGNYSVVGSANSSINSEKHLTEAAIITRDIRIRSQVLAFIKYLVRTVGPLEESELCRLASIEVNRNLGESKDKPLKLGFGNSQAWWLSTGPLSDRLLRQEQEDTDLGMEEARKAMVDEDTAVDWLRWPASASVAKRIQKGDCVFQAFSNPFGNELNTKVLGPATIVHIQRSNRWVRLYLASLAGRQHYVRLKTAQLAVEGAGGKSVTARSMRLLTDDELDMLTALFDKRAQSKR